MLRERSQKRGKREVLSERIDLVELENGEKEDLKVEETQYKSFCY